MKTRRESDFIGTVDVPEHALYGIHAFRAKENFPDATAFPVEWYKATGWVKKACYLTYQSYKKAATGKISPERFPFPFMEDQIISALIESATEVSAGEHFQDFIVPGISGGAGTSINMNVNEIIANVSLKKLGLRPGNYSTIDPIENANIFQSTNDVIPTALKIALMWLLQELEAEINLFRAKVESLETIHRNDLRIGYTQMQEAVPTSFGKLFGSYSEALSRDWWRVSKCFERLKLINLGGGALGTGMAIPRYFIMEVTNTLQGITDLPIARSENLPDATSNLDALVEVHAILKSFAVNLEKMVSDLRLLASDLSGRKEIELPGRQAGSSIMPGKVNPVIPEFVISSAHRVYSNDNLVTSLCALGCLELNAYLPSIGTAMIESIRLLIASARSSRKNLLEGMKVDIKTGVDKLFLSPSITTALVPVIGYHKATGLAALMRSKGISIFHANREMKIIPEEQLEALLKPENLLKLGYTLNDQTDKS